MRVIRSIVVAVVVAVTGAGAALSQGTAKPAGRYQFGSWSVSPYFGDSDREFLSCMAVAPMDGDAVFGLVLTRYDDWNILVIDPETDWGQRSDLPVSWQVDGLAAHRKKAIADSEAAMILDIPSSAVAELRGARRVRTNVNGRNRVADLDDTAGAMRELQRCVESKGGSARSTTPTSPPSSPSPPAPDGVTYAGWTFDENRDKEGRRVCTAFAPGISDTIVALHLSPGDRWDILAHNKTWKLGHHQRIKLIYRIDGGRGRDAEAITYREQSLQIPLNVAQGLEEIRRGKEIEFDLRGALYKSEFAGADSVIPALRDCVEAGLAALRPDGATPPAPAAPPPAAAPPAASPPSNNPPDYQVGGWRFQRFNDDKGLFASCFALAPADGAMRFGLQQFRDRSWAMLLLKPDWKYGHDLQVSVVYGVDGPPRHQEIGLAHKDTGLLVRLSRGRQAVSELAAGNEASFVVNTETLSHRLAGSADAIKELEACVDRGAGPARRPPQRATPPAARPQSPAPQPAPGRRDEAPPDPQLGDPGFRPSKLFGR